MRCRFTLIEVLVAIGLTAILFASVATVFHQSFRFRDRQDERASENRGRRAVLNRLSLDLNGAVNPSGTLAGPFVGTENEDRGVRRDALVFVTSGKPAAGVPFGGDLERVSYELVEPEDENVDEVGYELVRYDEENLLALEAEDPEETVLLTGVKSMEFSYHDGEEWQESWDSTTQDNSLPYLMKVRIAFMPETEELQSPPLELIVPFVVETLPKKQQAGGSL